MSRQHLNLAQGDPIKHQLFTVLLLTCVVGFTSTRLWSEVWKSGANDTSGLQTSLHSKGAEPKPLTNDVDDSSISDDRSRGDSKYWVEPPSGYDQKALTTYLTKEHLRDMAFLHVGKTGGATLAGLFRAGCFTRKCFKERQDMQNETEISLQTSKYYHTRQVKPEHDKKFTSYIVSLRDPIDRFLSYYFQAHPANKKWTQTRTKEEGLRFYQQCYTDGLDDLVSNGLVPMTRETRKKVYEKIKDTGFSTRDIDDLSKSLLSQHISLREYELWNIYFRSVEEFDDLSCQMFARSLLLGHLRWRMGGHMTMNVQYYTMNTVFAGNDENMKNDHGLSVLTWPNATTKEVFVIRTEHMWDDWQQINTLVGGGEVTVPTTIDTHAKIAKEHLPIHNRTISPKAMTHQLCCALTIEIMYYISTMSRSSNLDKEDTEASTKSLFDKCEVNTFEDLIDRCESW